MYKSKEEFHKFLVWLRNGTAFCTTWLLILLAGYNKINRIAAISTDQLIEIILLSFGGVFLFNSFFTRLFIKRWNFMKRLTGFMIVISLYEGICIYWLGYFRSPGTMIGWGIFVGIVLVLYFGCIMIYQHYSRRQGEIYTRSLQAYQNKRSMENGE